MSSQAVCYRHPERETNVACSNCGRPICTACMTPSPVGMRCPECVGEGQKVFTRADIGPREGVAGFFAESPVTAVIMALCVIGFLAQVATGFPLGLMTAGGGGTVTLNGMLYGPLIADGEWWRVVTPGFIHLGLLHLAMNMYLLYVLGRMLEPELGRSQMAAVYVTSLIAGSLGALIFDPNTPSAGASGAVFGLMGMALVVARARGIQAAFQQIGILVLLNLVVTFGVSGISKGAHVGGLLAGLLCGVLLFELGERRGWLGNNAQARRVGTVIVSLLGVGMYALCIVIARQQFLG